MSDAVKDLTPANAVPAESAPEAVDGDGGVAGAATARSDAELIVDELESASDAAVASLAQGIDGEQGAIDMRLMPSTAPIGDTHAGAGTEPRAETLEEAERARAAAREARIAFFMKRAQNQKRRGRAQLERVVSGAMAVRRDIELFDVNVASSAERFLGLIDLGFYVVNRRGEDVLGEKGAAGIIGRLTELALSYRDKAFAERDQAAALLGHEKELAFGDDWITPEYRSNAFQMQVFIKHPQTLRVIEGMAAFDALIRDLTILQWNGKVEQVRIDQARQQERRASAALHQFSARSLIGLNRRARPAARAALIGNLPVAEGSPASKPMALTA